MLRGVSLSLLPLVVASVVGVGVHPFFPFVASISCEGHVWGGETDYALSENKNSGASVFTHRESCLSFTKRRLLTGLAMPRFHPLETRHSANKSIRGGLFLFIPCTLHTGHEQSTTTCTHPSLRHTKRVGSYSGVGPISGAAIWALPCFTLHPLPYNFNSTAPHSHRHPTATHFHGTGALQPRSSHKHHPMITMPHAPQIFEEMRKCKDEGAICLYLSHLLPLVSCCTTPFLLIDLRLFLPGEWLPLKARGMTCFARGGGGRGGENLLLLLRL